MSSSDTLFTNTNKPLLQAFREFLGTSRESQNLSCSFTHLLEWSEAPRYFAILQESFFHYCFCCYDAATKTVHRMTHKKSTVFVKISESNVSITWPPGQRPANIQPITLSRMGLIRLEGVLPLYNLRFIGEDPPSSISPTEQYRVERIWEYIHRSIGRDCEKVVRRWFRRALSSVFLPAYALIIKGSPDDTPLFLELLDELNEQVKLHRVTYPEPIGAFEVTKGDWLELTDWYQSNKNSLRRHGYCDLAANSPSHIVYDPDDFIKRGKKWQCVLNLVPDDPSDNLVQEVSGYIKNRATVQAFVQTMRDEYMQMSLADHQIILTAAGFQDLSTYKLDMEFNRIDGDFKEAITEMSQRIAELTARVARLEAPRGFTTAIRDWVRKLRHTVLAYGTALLDQALIILRDVFLSVGFLVGFSVGMILLLGLITTSSSPQAEFIDG